MLNAVIGTVACDGLVSCVRLVYMSTKMQFYFAFVVFLLPIVTDSSYVFSDIPLYNYVFQEIYFKGMDNPYWPYCLHKYDRNVYIYILPLSELVTKCCKFLDLDVLL